MQIVMPCLSLPKYVESLLTTYYTVVLDWFSGQVYANLLKRDPQHLLVQLSKQIKWVKLEDLCSGFHHDQGAGAPPTHSSAQLVRALLVGYLYNWPLRQLERQIRFNLIVKWFVGYSVYADGPDHCTLERFEVWVAEHQHRAIFDAVLGQIDQAMPEEHQFAQQQQIGDTYAQEANAAKESLVHLIRHACKRLLTALANADPARVALVRTQMDVTTLFGAPKERREYYLTELQRAVRLQTTVVAALQCTQLVQAQLDALPPLISDVNEDVTSWIKVVHKIIADEVQINTVPIPPVAVTGSDSSPSQSAATPPPVPLAPPAPSAEPGAETESDPSPSQYAVTPPPVPPTPLTPPAETGAPVAVTDADPSLSQSAATPPPVPLAPPAPPDKKATPVPVVPPPTSDGTCVVKRAVPVKGAYRIGSATDPDATYRLHGPNKSALGYNVNVLISRNFVRDIEAATGAQPDASILPDMLLSQQARHNLIPTKVIYDMAAGSGKMRHSVAGATNNHTLIVAALPNAGRHTTAFGPEQFILSPDGLALTCPNSKTSFVAVRSGSGDGRNFHFLVNQCADCPVWSQCRSQRPGSSRMRQVFISDYRSEVVAARLYNQTDDYKADMKSRFLVERTIAALVRHNGGRRSRRCGLPMADFQAKMNATAFNLKRWVRLLFLSAQTAKIPAVA